MGKIRPVDAQELIQPYSDRLLRSAILLCGDESMAQDLVQETFLQALESAERFRGDSTVHTWLHGILVNLCHRRVREQARLVLEGRLARKETVQPSPTEAMEEDFFADKVADAVQVAEALHQLSAEHRRVVVLRYYHNLKIKEIAELVGVSTGTVKSRLHYAIRSLEQFIPNRWNAHVSAATHNRTI
jgi:RNA polymerase sigma-70 factor (ECF subfamily)